MFCVFWRGTPKYVLLGEHDLRNDTEEERPPFQIEISETFAHPQYERLVKYYDIGLIRIPVRIAFTRFIRPACLPDSYETGTRFAVAAGWGRTEFQGPTSKVLLKVTLELYNERECNASYADVARTTQLHNGIIPSQQFCAGSHTQRRDTCQVCRFGRVHTIVLLNPFADYFRAILVDQFKSVIRVLIACTPSRELHHLANDAVK